MRRASANLSSTGRIAELWGGIEQASFIRRLASNLTADGAETSKAAFEDFIAKMRAIEHLALNTARMRSVPAVAKQ